MNDLILVTGTSGTGKSSVIPLLKKALTENYKIYDFDEIWKPYDFSDNWEDKVIEQCIKTYKKNRDEGFITIILGLIRPWKFLDIEDIEPYFIHLDINKEVRKERLEKRKASKGLIQDLEELEEFKKWFEDTEFQTVDTSNISIEEVSQRVSELVIKKLQT